MVLHLLSGADQELVFWFLVAYAMYFLPFAVAVARSSTQQWRVLRINLLTGWTGIGWLAALRIAVLT